MEGNPKDPYEKKHNVIFEIKLEGVLAFNGDGDEF
jgi:hypothetical protein